MKGLPLTNLTYESPRKNLEDEETLATSGYFSTNSYASKILLTNL